ncbi:hypothetical protein BJY04DRAFT_113412 [Aspergillus karnatakaensis]|uniref:uncharacterized protein n=1 Tax=Aspergillus karnatakaensis TaxID=1810916 RepID=UPI003CCD4412
MQTSQDFLSHSTSTVIDTRVHPGCKKKKKTRRYSITGRRGAGHHGVISPLFGILLSLQQLWIAQSRFNQR